MPTRAGWLALVAGAGMILTGRLLGLVELYVLGAVTVSLVAFAVLAVRRRLPNLVVDRDVVPRRVHRGAQSHVDLTVRNGGNRSTPLLSLFDPVEGTVGARVSLAPLLPGSTHLARYLLPTGRRGRLGLGPLEARLTDPFGLATRRVEVAGRTHLTVLPSVEILHRLPDSPGVEDPLAGLSRIVAGTWGGGDFATLREYVHGDDLRRVHWPSSARAGDLLVRQDDPLCQDHLTILLDARRSRVTEERFEMAVTGAASIVHAASRSGDRIRLIVTDGTDSGLVDARTGREMLLELLAMVNPVSGDDTLPEPPHDGRNGTGTLIVLTGRLTHEDVSVLEAAAGRFDSALAIVLARRDAGEVERPSPEEPTTADDYLGTTATADGVSHLHTTVFDPDLPFGHSWDEFTGSVSR